MEFFKNPYVEVFIILISVVVVYLENTKLYFGKFLNRFLQCTDSLGASFPCYGIYDIGLSILIAIIGLSFLVLLIGRLFAR